jgi:PIN domain nuclease of toxin-antitoxin system
VVHQQSPDQFTGNGTFCLIALDHSILLKMFDLKEIPELHDKIIASTAKHLNLPIITKDQILQNTPHLKTVW